jgi:hypothetical protein
MLKRMRPACFPHNLSDALPEWELGAVPFWLGQTPLRPATRLVFFRGREAMSDDLPFNVVRSNSTDEPP